MANILLFKRGDTNIKTVCASWATKFIKCHDELKTCFS